MVENGFEQLKEAANNLANDTETDIILCNAPINRLLSGRGLF